MKTKILTFLICLTMLSLQAQIFPNKNLNEYVWDLSLIFKSDDDWRKEFERTTKVKENIKSYRGTLARSSKTLLTAMDACYDLRSSAAKLMIYGMLKHDANTQDEEARKMNEAAGNLEREVESSLGFLNAEIIKIGAKKLKSWIAAEAGLARHQRRINRLLLEAPYTVPGELQSVIETMKGWPAVSGDGFFALYESDLNWPTYKNSEGNLVTISYSTYRNMRRSADANDRFNISKTYLDYIAKYENIMGHLYTSRIKADVAIARYKNLDDAIDAMWLLRDGVPEGTYKTMIATAEKNITISKRYAAVLQRQLNLDHFRYADFYALPGGFSKRLTIQEAWEIIFNAYQPLGNQFIEKMSAEMAKPITHLAPMPYKHSFYANQMPIGGIPSYSMMTFTGSYANLRNLASLAARKVRITGIPEGNWPDTRDDPPIYGNGLLYVTELLLDDYLIVHAASKEEKIFHLQNSLFRLWTHAFSFAVDAELDATVQDMIVQNNSPSGREITAIYHQLLKKYNPEIEVGESFAHEWQDKSVQFLSFEGQFWVPGMASACLLHQQIKSNSPDAKNVLMEGLLGKTDTDLSYGMLKTVHIDLASEKTYQAMYDRMNELLDQLEKTEKN
jgi:oligoendopeptidase F